MKSIPILVIAVFALLLVALASPALSLREYRPDVVEFEMPAPATGLGSSDVHGFVSREVRAPKRFDLVGFSWEGDAQPAIALRVRRDGGTWSAWTPVPSHADGAPDPQSDERGPGRVSQPVWAGQSDSIQYRFSKRPPGLRLHFINTTGTSTTFDRVQTKVRGLANDGVIALAGLTPAGAEGARPDMLSRPRWGAEQCPPRKEPTYGQVKVGFVHHTVTANAYTRDEALSMVLGICRYHRNVNGWDDIGYNFLVDRFGRVIKGRAGGSDEAVVGAHTEGFNAQSTGVAALGTHSSLGLSKAGRRGLVQLLRWKLEHHGAARSGKARLISAGGDTNRYPKGQAVDFKRVSGHRDASPTECPGNRLYEQLPRIRERVAS
jgi:hypothetical protein